MLLETWILIFVAGVLTTGATITGRLPAVIGALAGVVMMIIVAFGALNLEVATSCCVYDRDPNQPLAFVGLGGVVINFVYMFADATGQLPSGDDGSGEQLQRGEAR